MPGIMGLQGGGKEPGQSDPARDAKLLELARQRGPQGRAEPQIRVIPFDRARPRALRSPKKRDRPYDNREQLREMWRAGELTWNQYQEAMDNLGLEVINPGADTLPVFNASSGGIVGLAGGNMTADGTTVTSSTVNPAVGRQYAHLTDRIVQEGSRPYQQYGGQRIAGFTGPEAMAHQGIINYGMSGGPEGTQQAGGTMGQGQQMMYGAHQGLGSLMPSYGVMGGQFGGHASGALNAAQLGATGMNTLGTQMGAPGQQSNTDLSNYMSQYTKGVTDPQLAQLAEFQKMQGQELGAQSTASGNLGGMREGVQSAQIARNTSQQAADILGKSQQDAFVNAQQAFQDDRAAKMAGRGQQLMAQQAAGQLGQQGYGTMGALMGQQMDALGAQQRGLGQMGGLGAQMGALGTRQANLGQQQQQQQLERLNAMQGVGTQQRELQQASMNMGYQDWQNEQNQNRKNINWQMETMGRLPYQNVETTTNYSGRPSDAQSLASSALGGMSLWQQMQNNGRMGRDWDGYNRNQNIRRNDLTERYQD